MPALAVGTQKEIVVSGFRRSPQGTNSRRGSVAGLQKFRPHAGLFKMWTNAWRQTLADIGARIAASDERHRQTAARQFRGGCEATRPRTQHHRKKSTFARVVHRHLVDLSHAPGIPALARF